MVYSEAAEAVTYVLLPFTVANANEPRNNFRRLNEKELATFVTISLRNLPAQLYHACLNAADEAELIVRST